MELTTKSERKIEALTEAKRTVNLQTIEDIEVQGRAVAANMLAVYGKSCFAPDGFVNAIEMATAAALYWFVAEGYVVLTEKALASAEEREERAARREREKLKPMNNADSQRQTAGQYL